MKSTWVYVTVLQLLSGKKKKVIAPNVCYNLACTVNSFLKYQVCIIKNELFCNLVFV